MRKRVQKKGQVGQEDVQSEALRQEQGETIENSQPLLSERSTLLSEERHGLYSIAAVEQIADALITIDQQFMIRDCNPAAQAMLGFQREALQGRRCLDVLCCRNLNQMVLCGTSSCPLTRVIEQKKALPNEELLVGGMMQADSEVSVSISPVIFEQQVYVTFSMRDLSALKVANQVRSNFVSMVSHELRTPLNSVHGFIDLLVQGHMGSLTEEQQLYLGYTQEGVQQLISIVEDILFMTRSDLGQFDVRQQEVHLWSLVRLVLQSLQPQALKAEVVLCADVSPDLPAIFADPQRIKQVLNNLVANALKFTPPGGTVTVSSTLYDEQYMLISVCDTGYGIPLEDRPHVFERFYQSNHSLQSKMGGYGLGLSIARLIVEQHKGTIGFDTSINKGSTFYFTIPLYRERI